MDGDQLKKAQRQGARWEMKALEAGEMERIRAHTCNVDSSAISWRADNTWHIYHRPCQWTGTLITTQVKKRRAGYAVVNIGCLSFKRGIQIVLQSFIGRTQP